MNIENDCSKEPTFLMGHIHRALIIFLVIRVMSTAEAKGTPKSRRNTVGSPFIYGMKIKFKFTMSYEP